jgi:hypothetical protein
VGSNGNKEDDREHAELWAYLSEGWKPLKSREEVYNEMDTWEKNDACEPKGFHVFEITPKLLESHKKLGMPIYGVSDRFKEIMKEMEEFQK